MIYGSTDENPLRIFGSRPGLLSNFNFTEVGTDADGYEFDLDSPKISPIRHLTPVRGGLLALNQIGVWLLFGANEETLTATNVKANLQDAVGASLVPPVYLDSYVLYIADAGQEIRMLAYDDAVKTFAGRNVSILSNHLFASDVSVTSLTYAATPSKTVYATQANGRLISLTVDIENGVFAATPNWTNGYFRECISIDESSESRLYVATEREINSNRVLFFERQRRRSTFVPLEDSFCVDAGLELTKTKPAAKLTPSSLTGAVTFTTSASVFVSGDSTSIVRCGSGKATLDTYVSGTEVSGTWNRDLVETFPETTNPAEFASGKWTLDAATTSITGLWHLEGETVTILADGEVVTGKTVGTGALTLDTAASRVVIGQGFTCTAQTLPLSVISSSSPVIESRRKGIYGVGLRQHETYGLKVGKSTTDLHEIADRPKRLGWTTASVLKTGIIYEPISTDWSIDNQIFFVQDSPRPAAILNFSRDMDLGDDKE